MMKRTLCLSFAAASVALAQTNTPLPHAPAAPKTISIQEMLVIGNSGMRLHSLAMITQGQVKDGINENFLPGLKACSEDSATPVRSVAARIMGQNLIQGIEKPNPEIVDLLVKLAQDESADVRFNAVYHGLTQLEEKSDEIILLLLEVAASNREHNLYEQIAQSLEGHRETAIRLLNKKLESGDSIAIYEIYEDMTGTTPPDNDLFLDMPSSRPKVFIFKGDDTEAEAFKANLSEALQAAGISSPDLHISGVGGNYVLMLKTYLTKDRLTVEKTFSDSGPFTITQDMWLTPELEIQIDAMRQK